MSDCFLRSPVCVPRDIGRLSAFLLTMLTLRSLPTDTDNGVA